MTVRDRSRFQRHFHSLPWLVLSLLLHLVGVVTIEDWRRRTEEAERFRARLLMAPRFEPRRLLSTEPTVPPTEMQYLTPDDLRLDNPEDPQLAEQPPQLNLPQLTPTSLELFELAARADTVIPSDRSFEPEHPVLQALSIRDSMMRQSLDLLRITDLALAGGEKSIIIRDPTSRVLLTGFFTITRVRVRGAGAGRDAGSSALDALARNVRDNTHLLVNVRQEATDHFLGEHLLKDPIHFFFEGGGLSLVNDWPPLQLAPEELEMLERYMREGGLVYLDGGHRYLLYVRDLLQKMFGSSAGIRPLPANHPIYHAFADFNAGFPQEDKPHWEYLTDLPYRSWEYPADQRYEVVSTDATFNPQLTAVVNEDPRPPLGLWGVELEDGRLVAVLSDLRMDSSWAASFSSLPDDTGQYPPYMGAGINLLVFALTRHGSPTVERPLPAFAQLRPVDRRKVSDSLDLFEEADFDETLYQDLDATLAVVRAPLGSELDAGMKVTLDGGFSVDLLNPKLNGVLIYNLPPGSHWIEVEYGGKTEQLEADLRGGRVATVTFGVSRLAMLSSVYLRLQDRQIHLESWHQAFSDLAMDEVFLGDDRDVFAP
ncbi:MAG: DUF4159 domain-containing protein [Candidatus Latescibacterota bacterium]|nr:DUF4159 domain-containing protein [Candidatus Latescibacterota bacterium]